MRTRYEKGTRLSERKYRQVLLVFSADIPALTAGALCALNYGPVHRLYRRWRQRIVELALEELRPLAGEISERSGRNYGIQPNDGIPDFEDMTPEARWWAGARAPFGGRRKPAVRFPHKCP